MKGFVYILLCADNSFYTGSTNDIDKRINEHESGQGANYTSVRLPIKLVYYEEHQRIDEAFYREKQLQGWSRKKKQALIDGRVDELKQLAKGQTSVKALRQAQGPTMINS